MLTITSIEKNDGRVNIISSKLILGTLSVLVLFFCTTDRLFNIPIDKISMVLLLIGIVVSKPHSYIFKINELFLIGIAIGIAALSSIANFVIIPMIYFPVVGLAFSFIFAKQEKLIIFILYYALIIHIIFGLVFDLLAFVGVDNMFVWSLRDKGLPFIFAVRGFTTTVQTFGTICILWLLLFFVKKERDEIKNLDNFFYVLVNISILLTFNRSTYIFFIIVLFFKMRKELGIILFCLFAFIIKFWNEIVLFLLYRGTLVSRSQLLEGFNLSFWGSHSILVYLFGKGSNQLPENILSNVKWSYRSDIENGLAMLLHSYGFIGLLFYTIISIWFALKFLMIRRYAEFFIVCYFLFIAPYFTQEYVTVSFYLFLGTLFYIYQTAKREREVYPSYS